MDVLGIGSPDYIIDGEVLPKGKHPYLASLGSGDDVRQLMRWAFEENTKAGSVSKEVFAFGDPQGGYFDSKYVVAAVQSVIPKGKATVATLKALPEADGAVKAIKKGGYIIEKSNSNLSNLDALAAQWNGRVDTLRNANFLQTNSEPRVTGTLFNPSMQTGAMSEPVIGVFGVVVLRTISDVRSQPMPADMTMFRRQLSSQASMALRTSLMKSLQKQYKVTDNRSRFW